MNNTLYITVGLPGSGKSTYVKNFIKDKNIEYLSSDELRQNLEVEKRTKLAQIKYLVTSKERLTNF